MSQDQFVLKLRLPRHGEPRTDRGVASFRAAAPPLTAIDLDDSIRKVNEAVQSVLLALRPANGRQAAEAGLQLFPARLLSVSHVQALAKGTRVVQVSPGTVITPLARDLLKKQGITIRLGSLGALSAARRGEWAFAIESETGQSQALRRLLFDEPLPWTELGSSLDEAARWLTAEPGRGVLWVSSDTSLAVWKACQFPGIRAMTTSDAADVHRASTTLGVNLLVVEPGGKSVFWLKQLATAFRAAGAPRIPDSLVLAMEVAR